MVAPRGDLLHFLVVRLRMGVSLGYERRDVPWVFISREDPLISLQAEWLAARKAVP